MKKINKYTSYEELQQLAKDNPFVQARIQFLIDFISDLFYNPDPVFGFKVTAKEDSVEKQER